MNDETRSNARERSPNYPSLGLPGAIDAARKLWEKEKRTPVPAMVAADALGYGSLSGAARGVLAALRQYGLIDSAGGSISVSDRAIEILVHPEGSGEWARAIKDAAGEPDIFRELIQTHKDASDSAINAYLISKKRFSVDGAQKLIRAFRETVALASRVDEGYNRAADDVVTAYGDYMNSPSVVTNTQIPANQQVATMRFLLSDEIWAEVRFVGGKPKPEHIQQLEAYLKVTGSNLAKPID